MTGDEFRQKVAELEAKANVAYGAYVNRRTGNSGRYWALGAVIAAMSCEPQRKIIDDWLTHEVTLLEEAFYGQDETIV